MEHLGGLLEYGFMGLALALAGLAFMLLRAEQGSENSSEDRLKLIRLFLYGTPVIAVIAGVFRTLELVLDSGERLQAWSVEGRVLKEGATDHGGVLVEVIPPAPNTTSVPTGLFSISNVDLPASTHWPRILLSAEGYQPRDVSLNGSRAEVDHENRVVKIEDLAMVPIPGGSPP